MSYAPPPALRLLVLTDTHYGGAEGELGPAPPNLQVERAPQLIAQAVARADLTGGFDAVALLGDLLSSGDAPGARKALEELHSAVEASARGRPVLVVPGNHDGDGQAVLEAFHHSPGSFDLGGCRVITFADPFDADGACTRRSEDFARLKALSTPQGGPIVALQHYPLHLGRPIAPRDYFVLPSNGEAILAQYSELPVTLSLSGHLHAGDSLHGCRGVLYYTARPLTAPPFYFTIAVLQGANVIIHEATLE